jgi:hypothetical protein
MRIGRYVEKDADEMPFTTHTSARMYRLTKIPQMMGLSFAEGEMLLTLMAGGVDTLLRLIGSEESLQILALIKDMEILIDWMDSHDLTVFELNAMITDQYSTTATEEIYNFLQTVHHAAASTLVVSEADIPRDQIIRVFATSFHMRANVMSQVVRWLSETNTQAQLDDFWDLLTEFFEEDHQDDPLRELENYTKLVQYCNQLSQYALIANWAGLNELDIQFMIDHPDRFIEGSQAVQPPSLHVLLTLSRLVEWQRRVIVGTDEAMRYFGQVHEPYMNTEKATALLAHIHGWNETDVKGNQIHLFGDEGFATNFEQLYTLETWMRIGAQLNVSSKTLNDLLIMSESDAVAIDRDLVRDVANNLMAAAR